MIHFLRAVMRRPKQAKKDPKRDRRGPVLVLLVGGIAGAVVWSKRRLFRRRDEQYAATTGAPSTWSPPPAGRGRAPATTPATGAGGAATQPDRGQATAEMPSTPASEPAAATTATGQDRTVSIGTTGTTAARPQEATTAEPAADAAPAKGHDRGAEPAAGDTLNAGTAGATTGAAPLGHPGWVAGDGTHDCPPDHPIKGNANSRIYHLPGQSSYDTTIAGICFATAEDAKAAGYRPRKR